MGPLTPVFITWPRKTFAQTWVFLWIGVAMLIASLLPWHGAGDVRLVEKDGTIRLSRYEVTQERLVAKRRELEAPQREFIGLESPGMRLSAIVVLLCALGLIINGIKNIWTRRFVFWPVTLVVFTVLVALWWTSSRFPADGFVNMEEIKAFPQVGDLLSNIGGWLADVDTQEGKAKHAAFVSVYERFGAGFYLAMASWIFLVAVIASSVVSALITSGKKEKSSTGGGKGRPGRRPGGRR